MSITDIDKRPRRALCFTPMETDRHLIVEAAVRADRLCYDAVIVPEGWGFDSGVVLTEIALRTERIRIVAGIQSIWSRTPAQLAMEAATLAEVSNGRFVLGLGASTPELATGLHGVPYERPAARLGETLTTVRRLLAGHRLVTSDDRPGLRLAVRSGHEIPIWVAGLGPRATELAVKHADAWFPAFLPDGEIGPLLDELAVGGSNRCQLVTGPAVGVARDPELAAEIVRQLVGWYLTRMGRQYGDRVAAAGFGREVAILRLANPKPKPGRIVWSPEADALLDELTVHGDVDSVARGLRRWDARADVVAVTVAPMIGDGIHDLIDAAAPDYWSVPVAQVG
jgi:alkanesulfonate monooxygenase SsuD/methylene tetrahydromethanopterin reductase-like flavin-dependent oxidoreductase (luciferase family)